MACTIDLGQCLLQDTPSQLHLYFTAKANLGQSGAFTCSTIQSTPQWPDPETTWIKEAPSIELRLSVHFGLELEFLSSHFIPELESRLCNADVWPELGFTVSCKSRNTIHTNPGYPEQHCVTLSLCRLRSPLFSDQTRSVPVALQNSPEIPPPPGVPTMIMSVIEISLEYAYLFRETYKPPDLSIRSDPEKIPQIATSLFTPHPGPVTDPELSRWMPLDTFAEDDCLHWEKNTAYDLEPCLDLIDFGLQKLIISPAPKMPRIRVLGEDSLQSLRKWAPGIFNRDYRGTLNQRAASIPVIAGAVATMFKKTSHPRLQEHISSLQEDLKEWVASSLWRKAQAQLPKPRARNNGSRFFPSNHSIDSLSYTNTSYEATTRSWNEMDLSGEFLFDANEHWDTDIGDEDEEFDEFPECMHSEGKEGSDGQLFSDNTESSFQDLYESTQTTQATQTILDSLHASREGISSPLTEDMLLSDCGPE
ncbi:hypothetical protein N7478_006886 [Penicillium angulare]|uniref:uncharacterized protein n=1 Tax=Penicillium angulare TaxID=116970 RepID=UPI0025418772|nr:uncharacterized protein N7478_006886 [Penicillium angulare]KAJ5281514.1 hypothetical protein N7478_006886 [Penicillium angulare]